MSQTLTKHNIYKSFEGILDSLSEKEKNVITRRVGLQSSKETLQHIGSSFTPPITRERVRQIEESGIKKMGRIIKATLLTKIQEKAMEYIKIHDGVISRDTVINNVIKDLSIDADMNTAVIETIIQSDYDVKRSKQKLGCAIYFYLPTIQKTTIDAVHKAALKILKKKKDVIEQADLFEAVQKAMKEQNETVSITFVKSCLELYDDIVFGEETLVGLTKWKILNPKTLKDKAIYVMKKSKLPLHFVDIANKITENLSHEVKVNTIHNELIRNEEFVLIGRGIYALKEWGFKPGTVLDVIVEIMKKKGEPMTTESITKEVLKTRDVKPTTIYMNLQNKDIIERVGRNFYQLKK